MLLQQEQQLQRIVRQLPQMPLVVTGNIRGYGISDATSDHYAWWLSYTGAGSYGGAKKYFACVHADQADSARASNIAMSYNGNLWISYS